MIKFSPIYFDELDSTNTKCKLLARNGAPHGTAVIAASQTAGKGRLGRRFCSPKDAGLYCTVLIREGFDAETVSLITPCAAVATAKAIEEVSGQAAQIKWVNDIFMGERKLCGILTEASLPDFAVIGIGINLLHDKKEFPEELHSIVTSIEEQTSRIITPKEMEKALLYHLSEELSQLKSKKFMTEYKKRSFLIGKEVDVHSGNDVFPAKVIDINDNAELILSLPTGKIITLFSGEVSVRIR
jgi:BirA family biotin operon repressor/biotin-[acetyl-CoA-carboxylase] ligase